MPKSVGRAGRKQSVIATGFITFIHYTVTQKFDYNTHNFHRNDVSQSWDAYYTNQPASFPEVTKETEVQREGQLIALAQLQAFVAVA